MFQWKGLFLTSFLHFYSWKYFWFGLSCLTWSSFICYQKVVSTWFLVILKYKCKWEKPLTFLPRMVDTIKNFCKKIFLNIFIQLFTSGKLLNKSAEVIVYSPTSLLTYPSTKIITNNNPILAKKEIVHVLHTTCAIKFTSVIVWK